MIRYFTFTSFDKEGLRDKVVEIASFLTQITNQAHEQIPVTHEGKIFYVSYFM